MSIVIDIKTRFIPADQKIYMIFPGEGYRFYADMKSKSAVFLDMPGLELPEELTAAEEAKLLKKIVLSERLRTWHRHGREENDEPSRSLEDLGNVRRTERRIQLTGKVRNFYYNLKKGDIVIVPSKSYEDEVLFGEIVDETVSETISIRRYREDEVPIRQVNWIAKLQRSKIPMWLERKIPTPNPVQQIEIDYFKDIFDIMYQRYFFRDKFVCKYSVTSKEFSSLDNFLFQQILLYVAALYENNHENNIEGISTQSIATVVSQLQFSEDIPDQRININSPGHIVAYSKNLIPIVAAAVIALCSNAAIADPSAPPTIEIVNSADDSTASKECQADVKNEVLEDLKVMGYERWKELCGLEENTRKRTGLSAGVKVTKGQNKKN